MFLIVIRNHSASRSLQSREQYLKTSTSIPGSVIAPRGPRKSRQKGEVASSSKSKPPV